MTEEQKPVEKKEENPFAASWKNGWTRASETTCAAIDTYSKEYMQYLDKSKTERESVTEALILAQAAGFVPVETIRKWTPGAKVFLNHRGKALLLAVMGSESPLEGVLLSAAHVDAPRTDLKMRPLREDEEFALFETHYYGGIKKYQWLQTPLALHGVVVKADGTSVRVVVGEDAADPVFIIPDVLPHLGRKVQLNKTVADAFPGEDLDLLIGSVPLQGEEKHAVKKHILNILNSRFGITEYDFMSAEIEVVPAGRARTVGFDGGMLGGYGQDDRVCAYASLKALLELKSPPRKTAIVILADKEEIGNAGTTGMSSAFMDRFLEEIIAIAKPSFNSLDVHRAWDKSKCLSADVNAGVDPVFKSVHEMTNAARLGYGPVVTKYTGSGGKSGANDASAEFMGEIRSILDGAEIIWQTGALGRVDEGGGGTVARDLAMRGADVVDIGVAVIGMHSLFEVTSKLDCYYLAKAVQAFFERA
jgi:aspartyl aminopeptidase